MNQVSILGVGGTIASLPGDGGATPQLTADQLVEAVPGLAEAATLRAETFRTLPSPSISFDTVVDLAEKVRSHLEEGADGVVVTQGTDNLEEVAFALDLLLDTEKPVVVTGAMRHPGLPGPDGPANLLNAVRLASAKSARGLGVLVVMNQMVHAARFVQKCHTSNVNAFQSPSLGPVGYLSEGEPLIHARLGTMPHIDIDKQIANRVLLVTLGMGDPGLWVNLAESSDVEGCVLEGLGGGHVPGDLADRVVGIAETKPVVLASRTGVGQVLSRTYGIVGGEVDLLRRGLIRAGWLDGLKSRVLLTFLIAANAEKDTIRDTFAAI